MRRTLLTFTVAVFVGGVTARAHHSYAEFTDQIVSVEGTLERVMFGNPHVTLTMRTKDSGVYTAIWDAAYTLQRRGVKPTDLKVGDVIVVSATPARDIKVRELARINQVRRLSDGWRWLKNDGGRGPTTSLSS
jgi:hypothetical protein